MFYLGFRVFYMIIVSPMVYLNYLHLFLPISSHILHFLEKKIPENVSLDDQEMSNLKNADFVTQIYTSDERERNKGLFWSSKLLLTLSK